jgi:hypothetical protein
MNMMTAAIDQLQQLLLPVNSGSACASLGDQDIANGNASGNPYTTLQMCCNRLLRKQMVCDLLHKGLLPVLGLTSREKPEVFLA